MSLGQSKCDIIEYPDVIYAELSCNSFVSGIVVLLGVYSCLTGDSLFIIYLQIRCSQIIISQAPTDGDMVSLLDLKASTSNPVFIER